MRILAFAGRLPRQPWSHTRYIADVLRGLARRGHRVRLVCDSVDDEAMFEGIGVRALGPFQQNGPQRALHLVASARRERRMAAAGGPDRSDVSISMSRLVTADVWMPAEPTAGAWAADLARSVSPVTFGGVMLKHHRVLGAWVLERLLPAARTARRILTIGPEATAAARAALHDLTDRIVDIGYASRLEAPTPEQAARWRQSIRTLLGIPPERRVVLVSAVWGTGRSLDALLYGLTSALGPKGRAGGQGPVALLLARDAFAAHSAAHRAGCGRAVRILGTTTRVEAALAACDAVAVPVATPGGPFAGGSLGRFIADALVMGRPVLAVPSAPGADLIVKPAAGGPAPGLIVIPSASGWGSAIRALMDAVWTQRAADAARAAGSTLAAGGLIDRLEHILNGVAAELRPAGSEEGAGTPD